AEDAGVARVGVLVEFVAQLDCGDGDGAVDDDFGELSGDGAGEFGEHVDAAGVSDDDGGDAEHFAAEPGEDAAGQDPVADDDVVLVASCADFFDEPRGHGGHGGGNHDGFEGGGFEV